MRILTVHNKYRFRGGEDESREAEDRLLSRSGYEIREVVFDNKTIRSNQGFGVGIGASWSRDSYRRVTSQIAAWRPDVVDIHNFFPLASPSVHYAARDSGIPVVQTLHNYRLLCPGATFLRDGRTCEECTRHRLPWPGVAHRCYRGSLLGSGAVSLMISVHRALRTWQRAVTVFVAVSEFSKRKFVEGGFPESRIVVKPNFVPETGDPGTGGEEFLYAGRLSVEKGIGTLLSAMDLVSADVRLGILGEGPLEAEVRSAAERNPRIRYVGRLPFAETLDHIAAARCVIVPSICYETFGRVAAEAYSRGTPVIAARIGALTEMVEDGRTGLQFAPGDPRDLARAIDWMRGNRASITRMRAEARREFEAKYTAARNYEMLTKIYERAIAEGSRTGSRN